MPSAGTVPAFGTTEATRPLRTAERLRVTAPTPQRARLPYAALCGGELNAAHRGNGAVGDARDAGILRRSRVEAARRRGWGGREHDRPEQH